MSIVQGSFLFPKVHAEITTRMKLKFSIVVTVEGNPKWFTPPDLICDALEREVERLTKKSSEAQNVLANGTLEIVKQSPAVELFSGTRLRTLDEANAELKVRRGKV